VRYLTTHSLRVSWLGVLFAETADVLWPRSAGSWPGYIFTSEPLNLPAGHFGLGRVTFATCVLASGTEASERLTGKWPGIGISPKSAFAALISETVAFENVQM